MVAVDDQVQQCLDEGTCQLLLSSEECRDDDGGQKPVGTAGTVVAAMRSVMLEGAVGTACTGMAAGGAARTDDDTVVADDAIAIGTAGTVVAAGVGCAAGIAAVAKEQQLPSPEKDHLLLPPSITVDEELKENMPSSFFTVDEQSSTDKWSPSAHIEVGPKNKPPASIRFEEIPTRDKLPSATLLDSVLTLQPHSRQDYDEKEEGPLIEEKDNDDDTVVSVNEDQELQHPAAIYISNAQLAAEKAIAATIEVVHSSPNNASFPLQVAGTTFNLSSYHFASNNNSAKLYNNLSIPRKSRIEYIDFSRPHIHLYMWDRRHAVALSLLSPETGRYQTRFYLAMTNLCMPLDEKGDSISEELVLLDILYRLDPYAYIDAVVGVVATGEVVLWKYSINHLRFNFCDFKTPVRRGEAYWFARLEQFYEEKGLLYVRQRLIPRDIDAPRHRFAVNKEYITHYKQPCKTLAKVDENFKKWLLLPGKNKSNSEQSEDLQALLHRANNKSKSCSNPAAGVEKTKAQVEQEEAAARQKAGIEKRKATILAKKVAAAKEEKRQIQDKATSQPRILEDASKTSNSSAVVHHPPPPSKVIIQYYI